MATQEKTNYKNVRVYEHYIEQIDASKPYGMSRTGWANYLLQLGLEAQSVTRVKK